MKIKLKKMVIAETIFSLEFFEHTHLKNQITGHSISIHPLNTIITITITIDDRSSTVLGL